MMNNQEEIKETEEKGKNSLSTQNQSKEQLQIAQDNSNPLTMISSLSNAQTTKEQAQILLDQADELYFYQGKTEESIILYDRVINEVINSQNNNTSHDRSVRIWDDAERTFVTLESSIESSIEPSLLKILLETYCKKANALRFLEKTEEALELCDKAINIDQTYAASFYTKARILASTNKEEAEALCNHANTLNHNNDPYIYFRKGNALLDTGKNIEALEAYDEAIRLKQVNNKLYVAACNNKGNALLNLSRYEDAIAAYDEAIRQDTNYAYAYYNKGAALHKLSRYEDAIESYDVAIRLKPEDNKFCASAYNNKGHALRNLSRHDEALEAFDEAIRLKPDLAEAYYNKGIALCNLLRYENAIKAYDVAIRLKQEDNKFCASAYFHKGLTCYDLLRYEEALEAFDEAIRLKTGDNNFYALAYYGKGQALSSLMKHEEAISAYEESIRLKPDFARTYLAKATELFYLFRYEEVVENYNEAIRLGDKNINTYINKARALYKITSNTKGYMYKEEEVLECLDKVHDMLKNKPNKLSKSDILVMNKINVERTKLLRKLKGTKFIKLNEDQADIIETNKDEIHNKLDPKDNQENVSSYLTKATATTIEVTSDDTDDATTLQTRSSRASSNVALTDEDLYRVSLDTTEETIFLTDEDSQDDELNIYSYSRTAHKKGITRISTPEPQKQGLTTIEHIHQLKAAKVPVAVPAQMSAEASAEAATKMSAEAAMKVSDEMSTVVPVDYIPNLDHITPYVKPVKKEQQNMKDVREKLLKKAQETLEEIYNTIGWGKTYESKKPAAITEAQIEKEASTFGEEYKELYKDIIGKIRDLKQKELPDTITTTLETKDRTSNPSTTTNTTTNTKIKKNKTFEAEFEEIDTIYERLYESYQNNSNIEDENLKQSYENKNKLLARISNEIGNIYCKVGRLEYGSIAYVNATELDTSYENAYVNAITTYFIQGFSIELLSACKELVKINPPLNRSFAYLLSSITLKEIGHETKAKNVLKKFLESIEIEEGIEEETTKTTEEVEKLTKETSAKLPAIPSVDQSISTSVIYSSINPPATQSANQSINTSVNYSSVNPPATQSVNQSSEEEAHIETSLEDSIFTELITMVRDGILSNIVQDLQLDEVKRLRGVRTEHFKEDKINRSEVHKYYQKILDPSWTEESKVVVIEYDTNDTEATIEQKTQKEMVKTKMEEKLSDEQIAKEWGGDITSECIGFSQLFYRFQAKLATTEVEALKSFMMKTLLSEATKICKKVHLVSEGVQKLTAQESQAFQESQEASVEEVFLNYLSQNQTLPGYKFLAQVDQLMLQGSTDQVYEALLE